MFAVRKSAQRGRTHLSWLDARHSFSFGDYHDPAWHGFRSLRVLNDDAIAPGGGFGMHPHRDMEILTWVREGSLRHRDSLGNEGVLAPGRMQRMTAGTGIFHSEHNPSADVSTRLLQIWIHPRRKGLDPAYEERDFPAAERFGRLRLLASPDGSAGSLRIHQDAWTYLGTLPAGTDLRHPLAPGRFAWVQVLRGSLHLGDRPLAAGDGVAVSEESALRFLAEEEAEVMVFELT